MAHENCNERNPCENGGKCVTKELYAGYTGFTYSQCECKYGFSGTNCENTMGMIVTFVL